MTRRIAFVLPLLAFSSFASADASQAAIPSFAFPLEARMRVHADTSHGCSQSYASNMETTAVALEVETSGRAELVVDRVEHRSIGPSYGRFREGDRNFSYTSERETHRYLGRARARGSRIELEFERDETGRAEVRGSGSVAAPATSEVRTQLRLTCRRELTDVYPTREASQPGALAGEAESAHSVSLLRCTFLGNVPSGFGRLEEAGQELVLGRGEGVALHFHRSFDEPRALVRLP